MDSVDDNGDDVEYDNDIEDDHDDNKTTIAILTPTIVDPVKGKI